MSNLLKRFFRSTDAQDLVEYVLIAGLISLAAVAAMSTVGGSVQGLYGTAGAAVAASGNPGNGNPGGGNPGGGNPGGGNPGGGNPGGGNPGGGSGGKK